MGHKAKMTIEKVQNQPLNEKNEYLNKEADDLLVINDLDNDLTNSEYLELLAGQLELKKPLG